MTALASKIRDEIAASGAMSFARFMELALYAPGLGYYEREQSIGQHGDFYTSVSVGSLFGELLAFQFSEWLDQHRTPNAERGTVELQLIEAGAHNGQLALDILRWFKKFRPEIFTGIEYCILDPSPLRREWQEKTLLEFSGKISWFDDWKTLPRPDSPVSRFTVSFSNELFDAFPMHRLAWDARLKTWFEWGVACNENDFVWQRLDADPKLALPQLAPELLEILPDGFVHEICPAACAWWKNAASHLCSGKLMAIDYGLLAEEFFSPQRSNGTLRAYSQHRANSDLLADPGGQDLTAHVDFTALKNAGENAGLITDALVTQTKFLTEVARRAMSRPEIFEQWNPKRAKQFQTLTHPEHLGRSFRVLVQSR